MEKKCKKPTSAIDCYLSCNNLVILKNINTERGFRYVKADGVRMIQPFINNEQFITMY